MEGKRRRHRSVIMLAIEERIARGIGGGSINISASVQLDLFAEISTTANSRHGRPRSARIVYRGSNRRGYRRE
jgi:hypothetical protein